MEPTLQGSPSAPRPHSDRDVALAHGGELVGRPELGLRVLDELEERGALIVVLGDNLPGHVCVQDGSELALLEKR